MIEWLGMFHGDIDLVVGSMVLVISTLCRRIFKISCRADFLILTNIEEALHDY